MRSRTVLVSILALGTVAGCTTTKAYNLSDSSDMDEVAQKESVHIDLTDGTRLTGNCAPFFALVLQLRV